MRKFFFFNDTATTEIYTLSLHDALPIFWEQRPRLAGHASGHAGKPQAALDDLAPELQDPARVDQDRGVDSRSEEHTSELQSRQYLVCRLLLEKKRQMSRPPCPSWRRREA